VQRAARRAARRRGAAFAGVRQLRHVSATTSTAGEVFAAAVRGSREPDLRLRAQRAERGVRPSLAWAALLLAALGLVMVYSASIATAEASRFTGTTRLVSSRGTACSSLRRSQPRSWFPRAGPLWQQAAPWLLLRGVGAARRSC
jgi:cell division protein FtsW